MRDKISGSHDLTHTILAVLCIALLIIASFWVIRPFLSSIVWAGLIVVATWPILEKFEARFAARRWIAVAMMTVSLLLMILIPITLAIITIVDNADTIATQARSLTTFSLSAPPEWIERIPLAGEALGCPVERDRRAHP